MTTFDEWCNERQIKHWRGAFYHYLMAESFTSWADGDALKRKWQDFLADTLFSLTETRARLNKELQQEKT